MLGKKIGLQAKSTLVLTIVVLSATIVGGWLYYAATAATLRQNDRHHARRLASGLAAVAGPCMIQKDPEALQRLVADLVHNAGIHYACVLGNDGNIIAKDERVNPDAQNCRPTAQPPGMFYELRRGPDFLEIGQPVVVRDTEKRREIPAGAVRLVLDTRDTAMILSGLRREGAVIALVFVLCTVPLALLLVRRVMLVPARKLAATMHKWPRVTSPSAPSAPATTRPASWPVPSTAWWRACTPHRSGCGRPKRPWSESWSSGRASWK